MFLLLGLMEEVAGYPEEVAGYPEEVAGYPVSYEKRGGCMCVGVESSSKSRFL